MLSSHKVERKIGDRILSIETGKIGRQADATVLVQCGDTVVLVAVVAGRDRGGEIDFFPLSVDYRERHCAAGKFPGGFIKREGRPSTKETLTARTIDRPIRPLFPDGYYSEIQVIANVVSADTENDPDVLAMIGASAALTISKIPFDGPMGACRLTRVNGEFIANPTYQQLEDGDLSLLLAGHKDGVNMIEVEASELPEDIIADAIATGHETVKQVCEMIEELVKLAGKEKEFTLSEIDNDLYAKIDAQVSGKLYEAKQITDKQERKVACKELLAQTEKEYCQPDEGEPACDRSMMNRMLDKIVEDVFRKLLLEGKRADGRGYADLRQIEAEVALLPRTHGSSLFTRGETQALVSVTLGTSRDAQLIDGLMPEYAQNFVLHYNFPPYSVGEVRPVRGVGRREIGHGSLAERALRPVKPDTSDFAYTIRIVSDITESNGSSSMASVCGGSLALMDAGVPMKRPVAGISVGMVSDGNGRYELLTDIIGEEDHYGDMDFKVAGTTEGVTAIQLDLKARGLSQDIMVEALGRAKEARLNILETMSGAITEARSEMSTYAPKLVSIKIDPDFIGKVIGPGGKMIKSIQEKTGTNLDIEEDGTIYISCVGGDGHLKAMEIIESITQPPKVGKIYEQAKVVSVKDFGVFVEIAPGVEGLCHVSELANSYVKNIEDVCKAGDIIPVKLTLIDEQGRLKLSRKAALTELGLDKAEPAEKA